MVAILSEVKKGGMVGRNYLEDLHLWHNFHEVYLYCTIYNLRAQFMPINNNTASLLLTADL